MADESRWPAPTARPAWYRTAPPRSPPSTRRGCRKMTRESVSRPI
jgi:hypothetical protein